MQNKEIAKVTIIVEREGKKTRYKKRFKKGEAVLGRIGDFMVKLQEDKPDEVESYTYYQAHGSQLRIMQARF